MAGKRRESCYTCKFWVGQGVRERGPKGSCHRFPPVVTPRAPEGACPITLLTDWCGEWLRDMGLANELEAQEKAAREAAGKVD